MSGASDRPQPHALLGIYLNDHLMGATGAVALARRTLGANPGTAFAEELDALLTEILEDREALRRIMGELEVPVSSLKVAAATVGERVGRLKLNGQLIGYSPLSRLVEVEALHAGADAKLRLWRTLQQLASAEPRLDASELTRLIERATGQLDRLERLRLDAATTALAPSGP